jgi:hypothetical protein
MGSTAVAEPVQGASAQPAQSVDSTSTTLFTQSYSISIPKTMDGVTKVFSNPDGSLNEKALIYTLRSGLKQVVNNRLRQKATAKDEAGNPAFEVVDGVYDATPLILEAPQRQILSQRDKLKRNLESVNMPAAVIDQMLATFDANVGTTQEATGDTAVETQDFTVKLDGKKLVMVQTRGGDEDEE